MKKNFPAKIFLIGLLFSSCIGLDRPEPKGTITKVKKDFSTFSEISIGSGFTAVIEQGQTEKVEIETDENFHQYIEAEQEKNTISFRLKSGISLPAEIPVKVHITTVNLTAIAGSGGSGITLSNPVVTGKLSAELSGGSSITGELNSAELRAALSGGSVLNLSGSSGTFVLVASGGSNANCFALMAKTASISVSGGGEFNLSVSDELEVTATGGSMIHYKGSATITAQQLSGGSELKKAE